MMKYLVRVKPMVTKNIHTFFAHSWVKSVSLHALGFQKWIPNVHPFRKSSSHCRPECARLWHFCSECFDPQEISLQTHQAFHHGHATIDSKRRKRHHTDLIIHGVQNVLHLKGNRLVGCSCDVGFR